MFYVPYHLQEIRPLFALTTPCDRNRWSVVHGGDVSSPDVLSPDNLSPIVVADVLISAAVARR